MKLKYLLIFLLLSSMTLFAQENNELEKQFTKRSFNWEDISYNCSYLIAKYFNEDKQDSVQIILDYWKSKQVDKYSEPTMRFSILYAIYQGNFNESIYLKDIINYLIQYRYLLELNNYNEDWGRSYLNNNLAFIRVPYLHKDFNMLTSTLATQLKIETAANSLENLLCSFYADDFEGFYNNLVRDEYKETNLQRYYLDYVNQLKREPSSGMSLFTSLWTPTGKAKVLGPHPELGLAIEINDPEYFWGLTLAIRFLKTKDKYSVYHENKIHTTNYYLGGFIGIEGGYKLLNYKRTSSCILFGLGYDGFDVMEETEDHSSKTINSLNLNAGIGYHIYLDRYLSKYIGFQFRYNLINYYTNGGTDLSGNSVTLRVSYSFEMDDGRIRLLKNLNQ
ncbi:MAG TPA: hypothetical protein PLP19_18875 [bacterium]|nr:hypothetical protein [bacterium]HPN45561.1 hypothetical protein [bacterium]